MAFVQALQDIIDFFIQVCIIFPYSAFTIRRQLSAVETRSRAQTTSSDVETLKEEARMISDTVLQLCTLDASVTSVLAAEPTRSPGEAWKKLYGHVRTAKIDAESYRIGDGNDNETKLALERAEKCGQWGDETPSELFLKIFHDALGPVERDVKTGMVSPSLMGSSGVVPLTILSTVPDIMRHQSNLIVQAQHDVFLATNFWANSVASSFLTNAMRELSARRAISHPNGPPIVLKILYDRGAVIQLIDNHHFVSAKEMYSASVGLPRPEEIPNIDLQVMNYHKPMLGTYHCKYMIVDRRIAVLQSNNVLDNDNLEMMVQLEGAVVDGLYDMALISWDKAMKPNLPTLGTAARDAPVPCLQNMRKVSGKSAGGHTMGTLTKIDSGKDVSSSRNGMKMTEASSLESSWIDADDSTELESQHGLRQVTSDPKHVDEQNLDAPTTRSNTNPYQPPLSRKVVDVLAGVDQQQSAGGHSHTVEVRDHNKPDQASNFRDQEPLRIDPVTEAYLSSGKPALTEAFILNRVDTTPLPEHTPEDPHYDADIASEVRRVQHQVSSHSGRSRLSAIATHLNHTTNSDYKPPHSDIHAGDEWTPYIPHSPTKPFPIALVNRRPHRAPEHSDVYVPQNEAWLAALRYAKESVFIQSPTLNTDVLVPAVIEACERGVDVFCFMSLGYNDAGELLPMQGGTNEQVSHHLYASLSEAGKRKLHYHYYVGADHLSPLRAQIKIRSCHVKLMIVDSQIAICGNGNMDTQSWYQSAEVNVLLESRETCAEIIDGLRRCQRTGRYGRVCDDGLWRDEEGKEVEGGLGLSPKGGMLFGLKAALRRVRGVGDFR